MSGPALFAVALGGIIGSGLLAFVGIRARSGAWSVMLGSAAALLVLLCFGFVIITPWPGDAAARTLCDRAVAILSTEGGDLAEITRAGIVVHELSCSWRRRLRS
jgi:hypothetical protein